MSGKSAPQETKTRLAALVYLSDVIDDLNLPIRVAEDWICPGDLPGFVEEVEKRVRALRGFIDSYLENQPRAFRRKTDPEIAWILKVQLEGARKALAKLDKLRAMQSRAANDFAAEAEELRKLRSGELKVAPPPDSKGPKP